MRGVVPAAAALAAAITLIACGGDSTTSESDAASARGSSGAPIAGNADQGDLRVIDAWATALRRGDIEAAARFFALPSTAENGPTLVRIRTIGQARLFNRSLPCGAVVIRAETEGDFTTATFRLTERPGAGLCGPGTGETARTAFVIEGGRIAEWRRVGAGGAAAPAPSESV